MSRRDPAPIYVDAYDLSRWILEKLDGSSGALEQRLAKNALDLLDSLVLALKDRRREEMLERADEVLVLLRIHLRLAADSGLLDEQQMLFALERADAIGRQLGGWLKGLGPA